MKYDIVIGVDELDKYGTKINFANKYIKFGEDIMEEGLKKKEDEQEVSTAPNKVHTSITDKKDENKEEQEDDTGNEVDVLTTHFEDKKMRSVASQTMDTDERKEGKKRRRRNRKKRSVTPIQVDTIVGPEEREEEDENLNVSTAPQQVDTRMTEKEEESEILEETMLKVSTVPKMVCTNMTKKEVEILDEEETVVFGEEESEENENEVEFNMSIKSRNCEKEEETSIIGCKEEMRHDLKKLLAEHVGEIKTENRVSTKYEHTIKRKKLSNFRSKTFV
uniref:Uncharacterized protein DDB_G0283697-like n=1 Tax=Diabrotica virgifera virgifera TaxID=50390 RepID=A0A6P7GVX2_DIAVI